MKRSLFVVTLASIAFLSGCQYTAPVPDDFAWGNYREMVYQYYGQKIDGDQYIQTLLGAEKEAQTRGVSMAPGLYAEIGTFYLRAGKKAEALQYYQKEADTWPQGKGFMEALIQGVNRASAGSEKKGEKQ